MTTRTRRIAPWPVVVVALVVASCGGSESTTTAAQPTTSATEAATTLPPTETSTEATAAPTEECTEPATEISIGTGVSGEIEGQTQPPPQRLYFCVDIPGEVSSITVALTGMTADLNLYVGYPDLQTVQEGGFTFWATNERGTGDKAVVIEPGLADYVDAGSYYIEVSPNDFTESSPFTLTVTTS
jgi:hypothetical protein